MTFLGTPHALRPQRATQGTRPARAALALAARALPLAAALLASPFVATADPLQLNEILAGPARDWDGSGTFSSRDDEWVEVHNTAAATLDLTGYVITDGDSIPRYALSGTLPADGHLVVYGKQSFDWEHANGYPAFGLSLGNSGDSVILWHVTGTDTTMVDAYAFTSHEAASDRAVGRSDDSGPWVVFDGLDPYTGTIPPVGNGCVPTPGAANACATTPTRPTTWGRLQTLYR